MERTETEEQRAASRAAAAAAITEETVCVLDCWTDLALDITEDEPPPPCDCYACTGRTTEA